MRILYFIFKIVVQNYYNNVNMEIIPLFFSRD